MGSFYYFTCYCLNKILFLRNEPLVSPNRIKGFDDFDIKRSAKKKISTPFLTFNNNSVFKKIVLENVRFYTNLLNIENAFLNYKNTIFIAYYKLYNKGRYSRNKQVYRTGVIWCLWLTVIALVAPFFYFYSFTFNFTYLWVFFLFFILKLCFNHFFKYHYFNSWKFFDFCLTFLK